MSGASVSNGPPEEDSPEPGIFLCLVAWLWIKEQISEEITGCLLKPGVGLLR